MSFQGLLPLFTYDIDTVFFLWNFLPLFLLHIHIKLYVRLCLSVYGRWGAKMIQNKHTLMKLIVSKWLSNNEYEKRFQRRDFNSVNNEIMRFKVVITGLQVVDYKWSSKIFYICLSSQCLAKQMIIEWKKERRKNCL